MASSIHIEAVKTASFAHNDRTMKVSYLIKDSSKNFCSCSSSEAVEKFHELKAKAIKNYKDRTGQSIQKKTIFLKEAIINLEAKHTEKDLEPIIKRLENYGFTVLQYAIHRDEGFKKLENGEQKLNLHAHITMFNLDIKKGTTVKFGKNYRTELSKLQTFTANTLGMERGKVSDKYHAEEIGVEYNPKQTRRLGTHEYKEHAKKREVERLNDKLIAIAKQKDLQYEIGKLREELKLKHANREQYLLLEEKNRLLKEKVKAKKLNIDELKNELGKLSIDIWLTSAEKIIDKEVDNTDKDARDIEFKLLIEEQKKLKYKNDELVDKQYLLENELKNYVDYDETKKLLSIKENNENELRKSLGAPDDKNDQYSLFMWIKTIFDAMINKIRELQNENKKLKKENEQLHKELTHENNSFITYKR